MIYGLMFWGNSSQAKRVFKLQKRVIRLIKGCGYRDSYREHFRDMNILPLRSQYIYSYNPNFNVITVKFSLLNFLCNRGLMMFVIKNREIFDTNRDCYEIDTRQNINIHMYQVN
jgi:hypothetical protein